MPCISFYSPLNLLLTAKIQQLMSSFRSLVISKDDYKHDDDKTRYSLSAGTSLTILSFTNSSNMSSEKSSVTTLSSSDEHALDLTANPDPGLGWHQTLDDVSQDLNYALHGIGAQFLESLQRH